MKKNRNQRPSKKMKPLFLVFCEGETEETYVYFLRKACQAKVRIIPHKTNLSPNRIKRFIQAEQIGKDDTITSFLMYDLDVPSIVEKLSSYKDYICITSNPCLELWFLLHINEQKAAISANDCIEKLKKSTPDWTFYKKGTLSEMQKQALWDNHVLASARAKRLPDCKNPSSSVYRLIEAMDKTIENESNNDHVAQ